MWYKEMKKQITASYFGQVMKRKIVTEKFVSSLKDPKLYTSVKTSNGKANELKAVETYHVFSFRLSAT